MATQPITLEPHELANLLIAKANTISNHITSFAIKDLDFEGLAKELSRMGEVLLEMREKVRSASISNHQTEMRAS